VFEKRLVGRVLSPLHCPSLRENVLLTYIAEAVEADVRTESAVIIDGKAIAATIREEIAQEVAKLKEATGKV
jgi:hypothetical protein